MTSDPAPARATLRWKLLALAVAIIVGVTAALLAAAGGAVRQSVRRGQIERLREGPLRELKQRCTDYLTDRDRASLEKLMASLAAKHDEVAYICFVDRDARGDSLLASLPQPPAELRGLAAETAQAPPEGRLRHVGHEAVLDITETTTTKPAYTLHLGLRRAVVDEQVRDLLVRITLIALAVGAGAGVVALGLIVLIVGPLEKLAADTTRLSLGDFRVTFRPRGRGELGRLADALDRLKESVLCALRHAGRRPEGKK
jgi:HAMP domain-containing protein